MNKIDTNNLNESFNGKLKQQFGLRKNKLMTQLMMKLWNVAGKMWSDYVHDNVIQSSPLRTIYVDNHTIPNSELCVPLRPDIVVRALHKNYVRALRMKDDVTTTSSHPDFEGTVTSSGRTYCVSQHGRTWTCNCHAAARASITCPHVFAVLHCNAIPFESVDLSQPHFCIDLDSVNCYGCIELLQNDEILTPLCTPFDQHDDEKVATAIESKDVPQENISPSNKVDVVVSTISQLRSGLYNASAAGIALTTMIRNVLASVEKFISSSSAENAAAKSGTKVEALAVASRIVGIITTDSTEDTLRNI